jgi:hypothetical protein
LKDLALVGGEQVVAIDASGAADALDGFEMKGAVNLGTQERLAGDDGADGGE